MSRKTTTTSQFLIRGVPIPRTTCTDKGLMFVVFGTGRSGTSAVAGCMHLMGIQMGARLVEGDRANAKGYFEDVEILHLNIDIIKAAGGEGRRDVDPDKIMDLQKRFSPYLKAITAARKGLVWGFKDPRTQITYPVLRDTLESANDTVYVFVTRPRDEVIKSLMRAYNCSEKAAEYLHDHRQARVDYWKETLEPEKQIPVDFSDLIQRPEEFSNSIADRLDLTPHERRRGLAAVKQFLDPDMKHF